MKPVLILSGPTASGKTALALRLAERHGLEIVSADAFYVYRGLDVGTAKPSRAERARVPHHLIDLRDPWENYDVAQYVRDAEAAIWGILARGRTPLVVGGTGFYLSALMHGLPLTPPADPQVRAEVEAELAERGLSALLAEVERINPAEAARLERNPRRVVRALEVYRRTGRFPGDFGRSTPGFTYQVFAMDRPPAELQAIIEARTAAMLEGGLLDETRWLAERVPLREPRPTAWQAIGYREALDQLEGRATPEETQTRIVAATLAYAKRQRTWLRTQLGATLQTPEEVEAVLTNFLT